MSSLIVRLITCLLFILVTINMVSVITANPFIPGDARKGRYIFRKCVACHKKNNTPVICPGDRTQQEWSDHFINNFKKCRTIITENNFNKYQFTNTQLNHLLGFLHKYGKDTEEEFLMCK